MAKSVKDLLAEANAAVPRLSPSEAAEKIRSGNVLVVDVRDPHEVQQSGKIRGAVNASRGMLEFRADPESQYHDPAFQKDKTLLLHCASGGRSALAGKTLQDMGYTAVFNVGGFKDLAEAGIEYRARIDVDQAPDPAVALDLSAPAALVQRATSVTDADGSQTRKTRPCVPA
jgi:rhodanese-related sulfurtransferase